VPNTVYAKIQAKIISSDAERQVKTMKTILGDENAVLQQQLANSREELAAACETIRLLKTENERKDLALEKLTIKCSKLTIELKRANGEDVEGGGSPSP
jgi:hypothetical protein